MHTALSGKGNFNLANAKNMRQSKLHNLFGIFIVSLCLVAISHQVQAATKGKHKVAQPSGKERLVLMPLHVPEEDEDLNGAMDTALVNGLQQKYVVFSGEQVAQKARAIYLKINKATAVNTHCDETRCMQDIAEAFQAELIASANVTKKDGNYFLSLSIQNIFDNQVVQSESLPCEKCSPAQVIEKLKILSGVVASNTNESTNEETIAARKLKAEQLKKEQQAFEMQLRNADEEERQRLLDAKAADDNHLAELKAKAAARRAINNAQPTTFPSFEQAQIELTQLNEKIASIEVGYESELVDTRNKVSQRYTEKLDLLKNAQRDEFEPASEFSAKQEKKQNELIRQRDKELSKFDVSKVAGAETEPLKNRIKALTDHQYIIGTEGIETQLSAYDAENHQFKINLRSKFVSFSFNLDGIVLLLGEDARNFQKSWQAGLIRPEAKVKVDGKVIEIVLFNEADNIKWVEVQKYFFSPSTLKAFFKAGRIFKDCHDCPEMVVIPTGNFIMQNYLNGSIDYSNHVTIKQAYAIGKTEVTQGQWTSIMGSNPSKFSDCGENCPVEQVSWNEVKDFIQKLNNKTGKQYRLPKSEEWEYACRAGGNQKYCGSDTPDVVAWYDENSCYYSDAYTVDGRRLGDCKTHPSAQKQANAWGVYDMSGNVSEWVEDIQSGTFWGRLEYRHLGGSYIHRPDYLSINHRNDSDEPEKQAGSIGFRLVRNLP